MEYAGAYKSPDAGDIYFQFAIALFHGLPLHFTNLKNECQRNEFPTARTTWPKDELKSVR
jgi:hypothetical protein